MQKFLPVNKLKACKVHKVIKLLLVFLTFYFLLYNLQFPSAIAQYRLPQGSLKSSVSASLGDFYLTVSGYIAPFASIVLTSDGVYLRATTADEGGYFLIPEVLIKKGFSRFCFTAIDFRRLGESYSCKTIPPATGSVTIEDIFLPPTLGLSRTTIAAGGSTTAWGYTMPKATVTLNFDGRNLTTTADESGFYQFILNNVEAGIYELYAKAELDGKNSLEPEKKVILKSLSKADQAIGFIDDLLRRLWELLTTYWFIWIVIPIIILIIILLWKLWPGKVTKHHTLHHKYFVGY